MAVIGNRIREVLRILHAEGQCTSSEIFARLRESVSTSAEVSKYLCRAGKLGFVTRIEGRPAAYVITQAGRECLAMKPAIKPLPVLLRPRGPCSVFDLARTL